MKRTVIAALTAASLGAGATGLPGSAQANPAPQVNAGITHKATGEVKPWRNNECRFQGVERGVWTAREERLTARCVVARWSTPGGIATFSRIIDCESGWSRFAYNPAGPYVGLGQHVLSAWRPRLHSYTPSHWTLRPSWRNSRTMLTVTARMMHAVGLTPWSCA